MRRLWSLDPSRAASRRRSGCLGAAEQGRDSTASSYRLLFFGTYDARRHPRVAVLMEGCRARGDEVVEWNVPLHLDTDARVRLAKQPWRAPLVLLRLAAAWFRLVFLPRGTARADAVVVGYLGQADVLLARLRFPRTPLVLDYLVSLSDTATDRAAGGSLVRRALGWLDRTATRVSDVVLVDTEEQRSTVWAAPRRSVVVVPVGAPAWWFRPPVPLPDGPLRVVFFGLYTPLQGAPVVARAAALLRDDARVAFTMIGSGQDLAECRRVAAGANVTWHSWVDPAGLPDVVAGHHVCLGVFGTGPKAARVVPNKVYQGAAAGCAVVTADTAPQRSMLRSAGVFVPAGDASALAEVLRSLAADPARVAALRAAAAARAEEAFRPEQVVAPLRTELQP